MGNVGGYAIYNPLCTIGGVVVKGKLSVTEKVNATIETWDNDGENAGRFQPEINAGKGGGYVVFKLEFFDAATNQPVYLANFNVTGVDCDGNNDYQEYYKFSNLSTSGYNGYLIDSHNDLSCIQLNSPETDVLRFIGRKTESAGFSINNESSFLVNFNAPTNQVSWEMGAFCPPSGYDCSNLPSVPNNNSNTDPIVRQFSAQIGPGHQYSLPKPYANNDTFAICLPIDQDITVLNVLSNDLYGVNNASTDDVDIAIISQNNPSQGITLNTSTGNVILNAGTVANTYSIVYEICNKPEGNVTPNCSQATVTITVNPLPVALLLTGSSVCQGEHTTITSSTSVSGVSYQLFNNDNEIVGSPKSGTGAVLSWTDIPEGTGYYVAATNTSTDCESTSNSVDVVVNSLPGNANLNADSPICYGEDAIFTISGDAGDIVTYSGAANGTKTLDSNGEATVTISNATSDITLSLTGVSNTTCERTLDDSKTVTVNPIYSGIDVQTACDSYQWIDGNTYTESNNTAQFTLTNAAGCDSIVTLDLTINKSTTGTDVQTACDSYSWIDGNTYTESNNTATFTLTNAAGCDSIVTLDLTINKSTTGTDLQTACDSYSWIDGNTYTESNNTAQFILTNAAGCDSIVTLDLTINKSTTGTDVQTACDSYLWIDGNTYTESNNTATFTLTNAAGCDSIVTLDLTINKSTTGTDVQTACDSYSWIDGNTYTESNNTAQFTLTNAAGCDSIVTLDLTINKSTTGTDVQTACDSYSWIDGNTYTESNNTAQFTLTNAAGCDSIVTLDLTINKSTTGTDVQTACDSYSWIDGNTYTESNNTAQFTLTNAAGCDSIVTLDLTINKSTTGTDVQTACDSYSWIDGNTYTESNNTAQFTLTNAAVAILSLLWI